MPVAVGPYGQSQPSCFDRVKMGFVMGCAVGMAAGALFGTFSCLSNLPRATTTYGSLSINRDKWKEMPDFRNTEFTITRIGMRGRELMGGIGKTMMQSGGTFGTFMAIGMGIRC